MLGCRLNCVKTVSDVWESGDDDALLGLRGISFFLFLAQLVECS